MNTVYKKMQTKFNRQLIRIQVNSNLSDCDDYHFDICDSFPLNEQKDKTIEKIQIDGDELYFDIIRMHNSSQFSFLFRVDEVILNEKKSQINNISNISIAIMFFSLR